MNFFYIEDLKEYKQSSKSTIFVNLSELDLLFTDL